MSTRKCLVLGVFFFKFSHSLVFGLGPSIPSDSAIRWKSLWPYAPLKYEPVIGINLGWQSHYYGSDLSKNFDPDWWNERFALLSNTPYRVVRIWLFESGEGIEHYKIQPTMQKNINTLLDLAETHRLYIYFTALNGNTSKGRDFYAEQYNILHDKYNAQDRFIEGTLLPLAKQISEHPHTFALDLINEAEASRFKGTASSISQIRNFVRKSISHIKALTPTLRITASAGWHIGILDQSLGLYQGLGLDFYDVHVYNLTGKIWLCEAARNRAREEGLPILLGEFGPLAKRLGKKHRARVYTDFVQNAIDCGYSGVLPWKLEDPYNPQHSLLKEGTLQWNGPGSSLLDLLKAAS